MFSKKRKCFGVRELVFFSLAGLLCSFNLQAQQNDSVRIKHNTLTEVVVTAARNRFNTVSPMPVQSLSGKDLEKLNSLSVADAIRYFSGVQLKDYGGIGGLKTVNVRSLGSAHTAVFYDGMSVGNAQNGQVDLGRFSLDNIEEIQLYNGQKATIFQPARGFFASNTLFLKSKTPLFDHDKKYYIRTNFRTGSFGLINPSLLYQQKISENLSLSTSGEWLKAHGKYKYRYQKDNGYDTTAIRQNGDIEALRAEISLFKKIGNNGNAALRAYIYNSERGLPGAIVANRYSHSQRQWDRNVFVHGSFQKSLSDKYELNSPEILVNQIILKPSERKAICLTDKIVDADNMATAIIKNISYDESDLVSYELKQDSLIIQSSSKIGKTKFTLKANSNGEIVEKDVRVDVR